MVLADELTSRARPISAARADRRESRRRQRHSLAARARGGAEIPVDVAANCARGDERVEPDRRQRQSANPPRHDRRHARAHRATRHPERARSRRVLRPRSMIPRGFRRD